MPTGGFVAQSDVVRSYCIFFIVMKSQGWLPILSLIFFLNGIYIISLFGNKNLHLTKTCFVASFSNLCYSCD